MELPTKELADSRRDSRDARRLAVPPKFPNAVFEPILQMTAYLEAIVRTVLTFLTIGFVAFAAASSGAKPKAPAVPGAYIATTPKQSNWLISKVKVKESYLVSPNGRYWLIMQADGRLALYEGSSVMDRSNMLWSENGAPGLGSYFLNLQNNGDLAVWSGEPMTKSAVANGWSTGTPVGPGHYFLIVQDDANVVIYKGTGPKDVQGLVWSRFTGPATPSIPGGPPVLAEFYLPDCTRMEWRQVYNATLKTGRQPAKLYVDVDQAQSQEVVGAIKSCAAQAFAAGIGAGAATTGVSAVAAAKGALGACLAEKNIPNSIVGSLEFHVESRCEW